MFIIIIIVNPKNRFSYWIIPSGAVGLTVFFCKKKGRKLVTAFSK